MNDLEELEIENFVILKTQDIATNLGIAESTVRKYCGKLEGKGYQFRRDENGDRVYTDSDQVSLLELMKLRKEGKVGLDVACEIVATRRKSKNDFEKSGFGNVSATQSMQPLKNQGFQENYNDIALQSIKDMMHEVRYIKENVITKDQFNYLLQTVDKVLDSNEELLRQLNESNNQKEIAEKENIFLKEKLDIAIEILQRLDEKSIEKPKGFFSRLLSK